MRVDAMLDPTALIAAAEHAAALEGRGYDGVWCGETSHDPFVALTLAATTTHRIGLGSGVAIGFARNPMSLAITANDLQLASGGRFRLGIGSQVRAHIERRFGMAWSRPAARMRELVRAVRHIWAAWDGGTGIDFRGEFSTHTLMPPVFDPGPSPYGRPPIFLAAVGPRMTAVAGEVADGLIAHSFVTERYLRDVMQPALASGAAVAGRNVESVEVSYPAFVATGADATEIERAVAAVRAQIAFYGSTPAYRLVLAHHGWDAVHTELHARSRAGAWDELPALVDDEMLHTFAAVGAPDEVARHLAERCRGVVDRVTPYAPYDVRDEVIDEVANVLRRMDDADLTATRRTA
jgi:probable F420-dependent oxidoreductase